MIKVFSFLKYLVPFTLLLFFAQYYGTASISQDHDFFYATWSIYLFLFVTTLLIYVLLLFVNANFPDFTGFAFLGTTFVKMMAAVVFLIPLIQSEGRETNLDIAAFFIPYFLFLLFETVFSVRLINKR
ncbi:hypothetical protein [Flavobacterium psychrolimnae]|uniref:Uncharacterized protein n=1 Tax=Flavobacterium psychrolimnae TaxID=249351 RepID=A0A366B0Q5_9FLAO|nr:hypothetical protein [Flavobacterium psychrolimnae]RBN49778.1 hypothetical protein DR980_11215 [Flavobacterium psychrolimnae]